MPKQTVASFAGRDPVDVFFERLPSPEDHPRRTSDELAEQINAAAKDFLACSCYSCSSDPDRNVIMEVLYESSKHDCGGKQLAALAMAKPTIPDDSSNKARQLRYLHWIATGGKDGTSPFKLDDQAQVQAEKQSGHIGGPDGSDRCGACGKDGATMKCGGCLISKSGDVAFSTVYCSRDCQKTDWTKHKGACKEVKQLC